MDKGNEDENLPSMKSGIRSMPTYFGAGEEDDDIPDMEEFDEADNVVENDTATLQSTYLVAHEPDDDDNILRTRTNDNTQQTLTKRLALEHKNVGVF
ncbi:hypothetical protein HID58_041210 [Brassica napus]|uniref:Uncharacterized protein n=1 Tax=Brassica napus TaxID=3708 RepID=A0ABQ8BA69_BRANA|nr:hypothetical protein HID58_041210 [Brassica napus]